MSRLRFNRVHRLRAGCVALLVAAAWGVAAATVWAADTSPPTEPGTISVSGVSSTSATLKWGGSSDNVAIEGYRVYRGPSGGSLALISTTDAVTSFSAKNLRSGFSYTFGVTAIDAADNESPMRTVNV